MPKCKYRRGLLFIVMAMVVFTGCGGKRGEDMKNDRLDYSINTELPRIPKLEAGMDVYALENEILRVLGPENVAVKTEQGSGSGILWKYDGAELIIITTGHLLEGAKEGELELWSGEVLHFFEEDIVFSEEYDMAMITIESAEPLKLEKGGAGWYTVQEVPEIGDELWVLDSVYGAASGIGKCQMAAIDIFLEDYGTEMLLLYGNGKAGMSGCPLYDENGSLVAMMSGMTEDGTTLAAIPAEKMIDLIAKKI